MGPVSAVHQQSSRGLPVTPAVHTIFFVHLLNLPGVSATLEEVIVGLMPEGQGSKLGAWEFGDGAEVQSIDRYPDDIDRQSCASGQPDRGIRKRDLAEQDHDCDHDEDKLLEQ